MNIHSKIKKDHDEARDVMDQILETQEESKRVELFKQLKVAILSHAKSEEKTYYQAIKQESEEWADEIPHFVKEHKEAEELFEEIEAIDANNSQWWEKFGELRKALMHHMEEEEKRVFKDTKSEIPSDEAKELGETMDQMEEQLKEKLIEKEAEAA